MRQHSAPRQRRTGPSELTAAARFIRHAHEEHGTRGQWRGQCPAHKSTTGRRDNLAFSWGKDGHLVAECKSGCDWPKLRAALVAAGMPEHWLRGTGAAGPSTAPTAKPAPKAAKPAGRPSASYVRECQQDLSPDMKADLARNRGLSEETIETAGIGRDRWMRHFVLPVYDPATRDLVDLQTYEIGGALRHRKGGTARLYSPDGFDRYETVLVCEGAWDVLAAREHGLNAIGVTGGAGAVPKDLSPLQDCNVCIIFDCDEAGEEGAKKLAERLDGIARCVGVLDLGLPEGGDVRDWFVTHGRTAKALQALVEDEMVLAAIRRLFGEGSIPRDYFSDLQFDEQIMGLGAPEMTVEGWVPKDGYTVFWGKPGVLKTFLLNEMQRSVRRGADWHGCKTKQGMTLMLQGEGLVQLKPRIEAWDDYHGEATGPVMEGAYLTEQPDLSKPEGVAALVRTVRQLEAHFCQTVTLIIIDPLVEFFSSTDNVESTDGVSRGLRALSRHLECAVVAGHHANADGERGRGTEHLFMRSAAWVQMEALEGGQIGCLQYKQKNGEKRAMTLEAVPYKDSLVMNMVDTPTAGQYSAQKTASKKARASSKAAASKTTPQDILVALQNSKGALSRAALQAAVGGDGNTFGPAVNECVENGWVEKHKDGKAMLHSITDEGRAELGASSPNERTVG